MRILHVLDHSLPLHSGYTFRTLAILREQRALGWQTTHLTSPRQRGGDALVEDVDGWRFHRTPLAPSPFARIPLVREWREMARTARRLAEIVREERPDVIHAHSPVLNAIPALRAGRRFGLPVVYEVRAFWEDAAVDHGTAQEGSARYRATRALETRVLRRVDAVTTICEGLRADIVARGIDAAKVTVIPNAVDVERFSAGNAPDEALRARLGLSGAVVLGFIGSFYAYEGLALLLDALPRVLAAEPRTRVLLVGGGPQDDELRRRAAEVGVARAVVFTGRVPHEDVQRYYDLVDVLVYPRLSMRLTELVTPLKPLEAMAQGRLVVASDVGGHRELIRDGQTGILFRAGDAADLATKVVTLLARRDQWDALKCRARAFVETERCWRASVARYRPIYDALAPSAGLSRTAGSPIVVLSSLFPGPGRPGAGIFIRERMFRVAQHLPLVVVSPQPWFPGQALLRRLRPHYRTPEPRYERQLGIDVHRPRFLAVPGAGRSLDGVSMALCSYPTLRRLARDRGIRLVDAHFAHPDGEAGVRLARRLGVPATVTLRGTEVPHCKSPRLRARIARTLERASRVFAVSESLRRLALELGVPAARTQVIGNGVDLARFHPVDRAEARRRLGLPPEASVLISVGGLVERKGIHRVLDCLPELLETEPRLHYIVVGGGGAEGDMRAMLDRQVASLGISGHVHFLGALAPDEIKLPLSAADVFVLATRNEGWANVFLEAMACGLPVVTTDVGGNREVVCRSDLGTIVPFGDHAALVAALSAALRTRWDRAAIIAYASDNQWDHRVRELLAAFAALTARAAGGEPRSPAPERGSDRNAPKRPVLPAERERQA